MAVQCAFTMLASPPARLGAAALVSCCCPFSGLVCACAYASVYVHVGVCLWICVYVCAAGVEGGVLAVLSAHSARWLHRMDLNTFDEMCEPETTPGSSVTAEY